MTGRNTFRQAMLLAGMLGLCGCALNGAAVVRAGSAALVARFDADRDGALDRAEVTAMVAATVPGEGVVPDALRAGIAAGYWTRDCDRDGRLTAAELGAPEACG
jgi:hypothetical protein